ncbi:hypothetical protein CSC18_0812 [Klebsiella aerogenes]|nr:hypothetical protein CSC18_0812 [Klebsiella aerogenes]
MNMAKVVAVTVVAVATNGVAFARIAKKAGKPAFFTSQ